MKAEAVNSGGFFSKPWSRIPIAPWLFSLLLLLLHADLKQRVTKAAPARTKVALTRTALGALRSI
jgi:hypothetical protein